MPNLSLPSRATRSSTPPRGGGVWGHPRRGGAPCCAPPVGVRWTASRPPLAAGCPDCVRGAGRCPPCPTGRWGDLFRVGAEFGHGSPLLVGVASSWPSWTLDHPLCGPRAGSSAALRPLLWPVPGQPRRGGLPACTAGREVGFSSSGHGNSHLSMSIFFVVLCLRLEA